MQFNVIYVKYVVLLTRKEVVECDCENSIPRAHSTTFCLVKDKDDVIYRHKTSSCQVVVRAITYLYHYIIYIFMTI